MRDRGAKRREVGECRSCDSPFPIRGRCLNCRIVTPLIDAVIAVLRRICRATKYRAPAVYELAGACQVALHRRAARRERAGRRSRAARPGPRTVAVDATGDNADATIGQRSRGLP